jgi:hypothetical protein
VREPGQRQLIVGYEAKAESIGQQVCQDVLVSIGLQPPEVTPEGAHLPSQIRTLAGPKPLVSADPVSPLSSRLS